VKFSNYGRFCCQNLQTMSAVQTASTSQTPYWTPMGDPLGYSPQMKIPGGAS